MLYGTGLRRGELPRLNVEAFDRKEHAAYRWTEDWARAVYRCRRWCCAAWKRTCLCVITNSSKPGVIQEAGLLVSPKRPGSERQRDEQRYSRHCDDGASSHPQSSKIPLPRAGFKDRSVEAKSLCRVSSPRNGDDWPSLDWSYTQIRRAGSNSAGLPKRIGNVEEEGHPRRSTFWASRTSAGRTGWGDSPCDVQRSASAREASFEI
jgi:hypothetical protein